MNSNYEIYIIGLAILFFLIIVFLYIRKISNSGNLKVKIEPIPDPLEPSELSDEVISNESRGNDVEIQTAQELGIFNLISSDKYGFYISQ